MDQNKAAKRQVGILTAYKKVFSGPEGDKVLNDLIKHHHILSPTFVKGDVNEMLFNEGERNVVLRILANLKVDVRKLQERIKEYEADQQSME